MGQAKNIVLQVMPSPTLSSGKGIKHVDVLWDRVHTYKRKQNSHTYVREMEMHYVKLVHLHKGLSSVSISATETYADIVYITSQALHVKIPSVNMQKYLVATISAT